MAVDTGATRTVEATVAADLAIHAMLESAVGPIYEIISHGGGLPGLPSSRINMYRNRASTGEPVEALADMVRQAYRGLAAAAA